MGNGAPVFAILLFYYILSNHCKSAAGAPQQHKPSPEPPKEVSYTPLELLVTAAAAAFGGALLRGQSDPIHVLEAMLLPRAQRRRCRKR